MKKTLIFLLFLTHFSISGFAQQNVGIGTTTPDASSMLQVESNSKGMLVPRMSTAQRLAIVSPANGLLVYDTTVDCFYYYVTVSSAWQSLCPGNGNAGLNALVATANEPAGANCSNGGIVINSGNDTDNDGLLDPTEITSTQYVCNGSVGTNGTPGTNGINCWDVNGNGLNDPSEDLNNDGNFTTLDCQGATGATGPAGPTGPQGAAGSQGVAGPQGPPGVATFYSALGTTNASTTSQYPAFVAFPQMTLTFTPTKPIVYVMFSAAGDAAAVLGSQQYVNFRLRRNGVVLGGATSTVTDVDDVAGVVTAWNAQIIMPVTVTPGVSTTIDIQWNIDGLTLSQTFCNAATDTDWSHRSLIIME